MKALHCGLIGIVLSSTRSGVAFVLWDGVFGYMFSGNLIPI